MISWGWIRGEVRASVKGTASQRFFSLLLQNGIPCRDLEEHGGEYWFTHGWSMQKNVRKYAQKTGMEYRRITEYGLPALCMRILYHPASIAAVFLALLLITVLSGFIWRIEINGNVHVSEATIREWLEEQNIHVGLWKGLVDTDVATNEILQLHTDVSFVSLTLKGSTLWVQITERTKEPEIPYLQNEDGSLVATGTYSIYSIVTEQGTPMVRKGDVVHEGDVLISGYVASVSDDGETIYHTVSASGTVLGQSVYRFQDTMDAAAEQRDYAETVRNALAFFYRGKLVYLWKPFQSTGDYDIVSNELLSLKLPGGGELIVRHDEYQEYTSVTYEYSNEELESLLKKRLERSAAVWLADGERMEVERMWDFEKTRDGLQGTLTVKTIEDITRRASLEEVPWE